MLVAAKERSTEGWVAFAAAIEAFAPASTKLRPTHQKLVMRLQAVLRSVPVALGLEPLHVRDAVEGSWVGERGDVLVGPCGATQAVALELHTIMLPTSLHGVGDLAARLALLHQLSQLSWKSFLVESLWR